MHKRKPVILDCDTGTDDAIAIMIALYAPELDVRAITTVHGNVALKHTSQNTLNLVDHLGFDTRVAVGAEKPIIKETFASSTGTHGQTGLGNLRLPKARAKFNLKNAVDTIYEEAAALGGDLVLIPTGPMTNIAQVIMVYPDIIPLIKEIIFMGGAMVGGNITNAAEFNAWADPEALHLVLNSGIPCKMIGLDVTLKAALNNEDAGDFRKLKSKAGQVTADLLDFMLARHHRGGEDALMHDGLAVAAAAVPQIVKTKQYYVDCECRGRYTRGHTYVATNELFFRKNERPAQCDVALGLDLPGFKSYMKTVISLAE